MNEIINEAALLGKFQVVSLMLCGSLTVITAFSFYASIFITAQPDLKCKTVNESTYFISDTCSKWTQFTSTLTANRTAYECNFDNTYFGTTIATDWGLYCDKQHLAALTQSFYIFGTMFSFLSGTLSDMFGRKKAVMILLVTFILSSLTSNLINSSDIFWPIAASKKYILYNTYQFIAGFLSSSIYNCAYTLIIELITDDLHTTFSNIYCIIYILGEFVTMAIYNLTKNWISTSWLISVYAFLPLIPFLLYVPESPR